MIQPFLTFGPKFTPLGPTTLDPLESKAQNASPASPGGTPPLDAPEDLPQPETQNLEFTFRHSGWASRRELVYDSLFRVERSDWRINSFGSCGKNAWVERSVDDPTKYRVRSDRCHDRFCVPCGNERARIITHNVLQRLNVPRSRTIGLTLRASSRPLQESLDRLYGAFAKLRRTRLWKQTQTGGVAFLEIKISRDAKQWHPHLHLLSEGCYIDNNPLRKAWLKATGDSFIVKVNRIKSKGHAAHYATKYATKPHDSSVFHDPKHLDELILAVKGRRLCFTYGNWRGVSLSEVPDQGEWEPIARLVTLILDARVGHAPARAILAKLPGNAFANECRDPPDENDGDLPAYWPETH